jgi:hypothetical protein
MLHSARQVDGEKKSICKTIWKDYAFYYAHMETYTKWVYMTCIAKA